MRLILAAATLLAVGCATERGAVSERDFARPELGQLPLGSVDLIVVVAGPPRVAEGRFDVRGFDPVTLESPILAGKEDPATRDALAGELKKSLEAAGYRVNVITARVPMARPVITSSTSSTAPPVAPVTAEAPLLAEGQTIEALRTKSTSDALLVVRAVPVDRFTVDIGAGTRVEETALGRERVLDSKPITMEGRLLVGQAFLFDRESGLRLWSRQAPEYPNDGRLTRNHPFLATGYVAPEGQEGVPSIVRATASARAFAKTILAAFPAATKGDPSARAALATLDLGAIAEQNAFFDVSHITLDLGLGWGQESSAVNLTLDDVALPSLGTGAVTPIGIGRLTPRIGYVAPGGRFYSATVPLVLSPSTFGRTYVQDNPRPTETDPHRILRVEIDGMVGGGLQLEMGQLFWLTPELCLVPRGGAFADVWLPDVSPAPYADGAAHVRVGAVLGVDLWKRIGDRWFMRFGGDGRIGGDVRGSFLIGGALSLGAGLLL